MMQTIEWFVGLASVHAAENIQPEKLFQFVQIYPQNIARVLMKSILTDKLGNNYLPCERELKGPSKMNLHIYHTV